MLHKPKYLALQYFRNLSTLLYNTSETSEPYATKDTWLPDHLPELCYTVVAGQDGLHALLAGDAHTDVRGLDH